MFQQTPQQGWLYFILFMLLIFVTTFYGQRIQALLWISEIERVLARLERYLNESKTTAVEMASRYGRSRREVEEYINNLADFFVISPVDLDPFGIIKKIEHLLNVRESKFESHVDKLAPKAEKFEKQNLEGVLEVFMTLNLLYKIVRHYVLLGKKTQNIYTIMRIYMSLPEIIRNANALREALDAFSNGKPIGDGLGPLVAYKLMKGFPVKEVAKDTIMCEREFEQRKLIVIKAKGPGSCVGKPGDAVVKVLNRNNNVKKIITVDVAVKLEGEKTGEIAEGVGVAIGGIGVDKYKIEEEATKRKIPVEAIIVKVSLLEAISPMKKEIAEVADKVVERIKRLCLEGTKPGDTVVVVGIGNSAGIGPKIE